MYTVKQATTKEEVDRIIGLRYDVLRKPWSQSIDTASDGLELQSVNAYIEDQGRVIACGRLQDNGGGVGQVRFMAVAGDYQGKGLGNLIMSFLEEKAAVQDLRTIELQARANAVPFYERNGYTIREKTFLLWGIIQHYLMSKPLNKIP